MNSNPTCRSPAWLLAAMWLVAILWPLAAQGAPAGGPAQRTAAQKVAGHAFPRIALVFPRNIRDNLPDLAKLDQIEMGPGMSAAAQEALEEIRRLNPDILFVAYRPGIAAARGQKGLGARLFEIVEQNDLFLRGLSGNPMYLWYRPNGNHSFLINKFKNDFMFCREYARANAEGLDWTFWDGVHYDSLNTAGVVLPRGGYGYSQSKRIDADIDEDGRPDNMAWACRMWIKANRLILRETAKLIGPDRILHNNSSFASMNYSYSNDDSNGSMHENCLKGPLGNDQWLAEMTGLWKMEPLCRQPPVNVLTVEHNIVSKWPPQVSALLGGALDDETKRRVRESNLNLRDRELLGQIEEGLRTDWRFMRYGLTTCLLSDAYFHIAIGGPPFGQATKVWWYDEFDNAGQAKGYLGFPRGKARELGDHPWLNIDSFETGRTSPCWKTKSNAASVLSDEKRVLYGAGSLFSGRAASPGLEPALLESVPEALGLDPNTTYAMSFDFRVEEEIGRDFYVSLYTYEEGQRQFIASLLSFREDKGYAGTAKTSFTSHSEKSPFLGFLLRNWPTPAQPQGSLVVDNLRILKLGAWRRDYDNGIVLCNPTSRPVRVQLEKPYRRIRGTQCPQVNDGSLVESVVLPAYDGLILTQGSTPSEHPG